MVDNSASLRQLQTVSIGEQAQLWRIFLVEERCVKYLNEGRGALELSEDGLLASLMVSPGHIKPIVIVADTISLTVECHIRHHRLIVIVAANVCLEAAKN